MLGVVVARGKRHWRKLLSPSRITPGPFCRIFAYIIVVAVASFHTNCKTVLRSYIFFSLFTGSKIILTHESPSPEFAIFISNIQRPPQPPFPTMHPTRSGY